MTDLPHWGWLLLAAVGPLPLVPLWRWLILPWWSRRNVRDTMAYRREKFGGAIRRPGSVEVTQLDRSETGTPWST